VSIQGSGTACQLQKNKSHRKIIGRAAFNSPQGQIRRKSNPAQCEPRKRNWDKDFHH
jgi:hypothetical protein